MELSEFAAVVPNFDGRADREKVRHFGWYLHTHRIMQEFATGDIRKCFEDLRLVPPNVSLHLKRMAEAKQPNLIRLKGKYKLHRRDMAELDALYAVHPTTVAASKLLTDLPARARVSPRGDRLLQGESLSRGDHHDLEPCLRSSRTLDFRRSWQSHGS
jgi:hypothetical protein